VNHRLSNIEYLIKMTGVLPDSAAASENRRPLPAPGQLNFITSPQLEQEASMLDPMNDFGYAKFIG
jgi:hypothetical protein